MWCDENNLAPLSSRSFSDAVVAHAGKSNLTNPAGRRVWGFLRIEAVARPCILSAENTDFKTLRTYIPAAETNNLPPYVCMQQKAQVFISDLAVIISRLYENYVHEWNSGKK